MAKMEILKELFSFNEFDDDDDFGRTDDEFDFDFDTTFGLLILLRGQKFIDPIVPRFSR
mgnify:CR=1 FL=1